jgi:phosphate transport system protein
MQETTSETASAEKTASAENMDDPLARLESQHRDTSGTRQRLHEQLEDLDAQLIALMRDVSERVSAATEAFLEADAHRAASLKTADDELTRRCTQLEEAGYLLLATQSPVASDLRRTIAVLRSVNDVQRSGNLLKHVVESLSWIHPPSLPQELRDNIRQLGAVSSEMFATATTAWVQHDALAAEDLERRDDEVDLLQKELLSELYTGRQSIEESVSLGLIARYYERIADHAVAIARHLTFFLTGDRLSDRPDTE